METVYIAYFDFLAFKNFITSKEDENIENRMDHILRDIGLAISQGAINKPKGAVATPDVSECNIHSVFISDTVIFFSKDLSIESLKEMLKVTYHFNWTINAGTVILPIRGVLTKGKLNSFQDNLINKKESRHSVACPYGKGLVEAHLKCENQNWAGAYIESSVVHDCINNGIDMNDYAIKHPVPFKDGYKDEYVFKLVKSNLNQEAFGIMKKRIQDTFKNGAKDDMVAKDKLKNTLKFLERFKE